MTVTIKLNNHFIRIFWAGLGLLICLASASSVFSHFLIRNIADRRIVLNLDALSVAAKRFPGSSRVQFRFAEAEVEAATVDGGMFSAAQEHAKIAANLSPWDYRYWRLLALANDAEGKAYEAAEAVKVAAKLAPGNSEVNWLLANIWLSENKQPEALKAFQVATRTNKDLLPAAFDVIWQAFGNDVLALDLLVNGDSTAKLALAQFLVEQGQVDSAISVFRSVDTQAKLKSPSAPAFITWLIQSNRSPDARQLWLDVVGKDAVSETGIWNSGFEQSAPKDFGHFDWSLKASNYARIGIDRSIHRTGSKSLKLSFVGRDTTRLENEILQMVVLKANTRYRLECYALVANLVTPEGPRIALVGQRGILAVSGPVVADSANWQRLVIDLAPLSENVVANVAIVRIPKAEYDEPTKGTVWFDDFKLTEQ